MNSDDYIKARAYDLARSITAANPSIETYVVLDLALSLALRGYHNGSPAAVTMEEWARNSPVIKEHFSKANKVQAIRLLRQHFATPHHTPGLVECKRVIDALWDDPTWPS